MISGKFGVDKIIQSRHYTLQDAIDKNAIQEVENQIIGINKETGQLLMKLLLWRKNQDSRIKTPQDK